ncbi:MAG: methyltransferase, partial [Dehalococcoidia bacterium]
MRIGDRVVRLFTSDGNEEFTALASTEFFQHAVQSSQIVGTRRLDAVPVVDVGGEWSAAVEHDLVPVISYPFEWTFSMLRDAALLQLELTERGLSDGIITKDATPYNVQFLGSAPVFIDVGSFERLTSGDTWFGYRQFCEQFLNPLLVGAAGLPWRPWIRGAIHGISPAECRDVLPLRRRVRPSVFAHVGLHAWAERRYARSERDVRSELRAAGFGAGVIRAQARRLRKLVRRLQWKATDTAWSDYGDRSHYAATDLEAKESFVRAVVARRRWKQVLDLGANDGHFTELVLPHAEYAVAVDADEVAIDRLYNRLRSRDERRILPLCIDLSDPGGSFGWRGVERTAFFERVRPDLVLFLAVAHHFAITDSIPLEEIAAMLAAFDAETIVELPTHEDPMVKRLLGRKKLSGTRRYDAAAFEAAVRQHGFEIVARTALPSGTRVMYDLQRA